MRYLSIAFGEQIDLFCEECAKQPRAIDQDLGPYSVTNFHIPSCEWRTTTFRIDQTLSRRAIESRRGGCVYDDCAKQLLTEDQLSRFESIARIAGKIGVKTYLRLLGWKPVPKNW